MGKTSRVLRSIVSPALGLSIGALATAGAAVTGCNRTPTDETSNGSERIPVPGSMPPPQPLPPRTTASASAAPTPETTAPGPPSTSSSRPPIRRPGVTTAPHGPLPRPGPAPRDPIEFPGKTVAPGFAPSSATATREAARRGTRRATDPDRRALRGGIAARGSLV